MIAAPPRTKRPLWVWLLVALGVLIALAGVGLTVLLHQLAAPVDRSSLRPRLQRVVLVPIGQPAVLDLHALAAHYLDEYSITIRILPPITPGPAQRDAVTGQLVAEDLVTFMRGAYLGLNADRGALLIGLTESDMNIREMPHWAWAYAWRTGGRFAVISSARMDPTFHREQPDSHLLHTRARKMITKTIGLQYYGLLPSLNPNSVLYNSILGPADLDRVAEEL